MHPALALALFKAQPPELKANRRDLARCNIDRPQTVRAALALLALAPQHGLATCMYQWLANPSYGRRRTGADERGV